MRAWTAPQLPRLPGTGYDLRVYDTAAAQVRPLAPGPSASLYVCGITPYDATHLGHAATYLAFDLLQRVLRDAGTEVRYVQNVTDVDDPLLERARQTGQDWRGLATREIELFRSDMSALSVLPPAVYLGVVEAIPLVIDMISTLLARGAAYLLDGDVYFPVAASSRVGEVSHLDYPRMLELSRERGGDPDRPGKKDPLDPLLWRAERPGEPSWPSPFGPGRPGWHVECAAIAVAHLGASIDVQGGGEDLAFPHHEFGAAHACAATGAWPFARAYVHTGMVGLDGEKMSKSRGNLVFVSRLLAAGVDPAALRMALQSHHYRASWEWTGEVLERSRHRLRRWRQAFALPAGPPADQVLDDVRRHLADDLQAPLALDDVDRWVEHALVRGGRDTAAPAAARAVSAALLGVT